ncbi:MAG TPA: hypothetical protein P5556_09360 [Candidatus Gastranaerophilales bacterium]|nr:hypothetical protein [Candidatus Gastranaerophilales bacterium]
MIPQVGLSNVGFGQLSIKGKPLISAEKALGEVKLLFQNEPVKIYPRHYGNTLSKDCLVVTPDRKADFSRALRNPEIEVNGKELKLSNIPRYGISIDPNGEIKKL